MRNETLAGSEALREERTRLLADIHVIYFILKFGVLRPELSEFPLEASGPRKHKVCVPFLFFGWPLRTRNARWDLVVTASCQATIENLLHMPDFFFFIMSNIILMCSSWLEMQKNSFG